MTALNIKPLIHSINSIIIFPTMALCADCAVAHTMHFSFSTRAAGCFPETGWCTRRVRCA